MMKNGAVLDERIFWMEMDDGEYDTGRPLTLDQLKREFGDNRNFPLDAFLVIIRTDLQSILSSDTRSRP